MGLLGLCWVIKLLISMGEVGDGVGGGRYYVATETLHPGLHCSFREELT